MPKLASGYRDTYLVGIQVDESIGRETPISMILLWHTREER